MRASSRHGKKSRRNRHRGCIAGHCAFAVHILAPMACVNFFPGMRRMPLRRTIVCMSLLSPSITIMSLPAMRIAILITFATLVNLPSAPVEMDGFATSEWSMQSRFRVPYQTISDYWQGPARGSKAVTSIITCHCPIRFRNRGYNTFHFVQSIVCRKSLTLPLSLFAVTFFFLLLPKSLVSRGKKKKEQTSKFVTLPCIASHSVSSPPVFTINV